MVRRYILRAMGWCIMVFNPFLTYVLVVLIRD
jgi:hypothetical protein